MGTKQYSRHDRRNLIQASQGDTDDINEDLFYSDDKSNHCKIKVMLLKKKSGFVMRLNFSPINME